ncbi:MAG: chromate transporter [Treponema sp.]|jgi:chromate transporter|nr:chromate transporter [Treponema sp.]
MSLLLLYIEFFQIGLFAIGGGLATLPFLYKLAEKYDWLSIEMIGNIQAVAQTLPGAIGVNMSAYTGFKCSGIAGAIIAPLALISPSIIIIVIIAKILHSFKENNVVKAVFSGLRPAAGGLICTAGFFALRLSLYNAEAVNLSEKIRFREGILFVVLLFLLMKFKKHPIVYIAIAGIAGVIFKF